MRDDARNSLSKAPKALATLSSSIRMSAEGRGCHARRQTLAAITRAHRADSAILLTPGFAESGRGPVGMARTQLQSPFSKIGSRKQSDVVSLMARKRPILTYGWHEKLSWTPIQTNDDGYGFIRYNA